MRVRDSRFLLAALLLHAGAILAARATASRVLEARAWLEAPPLSTQDVDLSLIEAPLARPQVPPQALARTPLPDRSPSPPRAREPAPRPEEPTAPEAELPDPYDSPPPPPSPVAPGLDGVPVWALPGVLPDAPPLAPRASKRPIPPLAAAIREDLDKKDGAGSVRVFPAAGTLVAAVVEEIRASITPADAESSFELSLDAKGLLVSVRFLKANAGNGDDFRQIARAVQARFSERALPMNGDFVNGAKITVHASSKMTVPDGTSHGIPKLMRKPDSTQPLIREESLDNRFRGGYGAHLPPPGTERLLPTFEMDLANIGAKRRRVVHTRVEVVPLAQP